MKLTVKQPASTVELGDLPIYTLFTPECQTTGFKDSLFITVTDSPPYKGADARLVVQISGPKAVTTMRMLVWRVKPVKLVEATVEVVSVS